MQNVGPLEQDLLFKRVENQIAGSVATSSASSCITPGFVHRHEVIVDHVE
jgi:hypothetical protein